MASADIQGMRAIAVLMVIGCHAGLPIAGGFAGVDVFFVVSGFVITAMLMREWRATGRIDLAQFYLRRALRLIPALAVLVAFVMLAAVVISNRSAGYVHPERGWLTVVDDRGRRARTAEEAVAFWRSGLEDVVARLREAGIPVLIVASVPEMPRSADQRSIFAQAFGGRSIGVSLAEVVADRRSAYEAERAVTAGDPAATVFDPLPALCNEVCASAVDGTIHYQDATHLSVDGALLLAPGLRTSLQVVLQSDVASL